MFKYTFQELIKLKESVDLLRDLEQREVSPLTDELLEALKRGFLYGSRYFNNGPNYIFDKSEGGACGCIGPKQGDPFCGCMMARLRYEYRYDLAISLLLETEQVQPEDIQWVRKELKLV